MSPESRACRGSERRPGSAKRARRLGIGRGHFHRYLVFPETLGAPRASAGGFRRQDFTNIYRQTLNCFEDFW